MASHRALIIGRPRSRRQPCTFYAGNNLDEARELFAEEVKRRPRIRLTIRQLTRVQNSGRPPNYT